MKKFLQISKAWPYRLNWPILAILIIGIFLRSYKALDFFMYGHDQDLAGWFIRDVLENNHLRLIGQETSSHGVFIGPLFYYLLIPFYVLFNMDPKGGLLLSIILGAFTVLSFYFVLGKIFGKKVGLISVFVYSISSAIVFTDREVVPTMPVVLWTVWFAYSIHLLLKGVRKAYLLIGLLLGLIWNLNLALVVLAPIIILAQVISKRKINFKFALLGIAIFFASLSPFIVFELRHGFLQTNAIVSSLVSPKDYVEGTGRGYAKFDRVLQLVHANTRGIFLGMFVDVPVALTFFVLVGILIFLIYKKLIPGGWGIIFSAWLIFYILFFTFNSINISEYYLNGMNFVWIAVFAIGVSYLISRKRNLGIAVLVIFTVLNLIGFFSKTSNESGYIQRKAIVDYIDKDAKDRGYPCISVSYIVSPGNDLGYRYFFWLKKMHVNQSKSLAPVYTIVFPHSMVDRIDKSFGALGLVLPDYGRYTKSGIEESCKGENSNLTDPMFGFTK